ncbi:holin [Absicoccus intestinalis]|uniref:Holin n=1 Tax=Absicoccus intestinalis TaxID=2926319 RepID=A0ABU4WMA4_9FIRM|nr:holin [Absicoccus sp. CLA-KB-P134]MDX8416549.1 holin [Absicoccus sp. CLA-KB-P134]
MDKLQNKTWWDAALIRAVKTICQTAVGTIGASTMIEAVDWKVVLSASLLAGLVSLLTSLGGLPEVDDGNA